MMEPSHRVNRPSEATPACGPARRSFRGAWLIALLVALIPLGFLCHSIKKYSIDFPHTENWEVLIRLRKSYEEPFSLSTFLQPRPYPDPAQRHLGPLSYEDFWESHNGHRLVLPHIVFLGLGRATHWNTRAELVVCVLFAIGTFSLLAGQIRRTARQANVAWLPLAVPIVAMQVFTLAQKDNWLTGWQLQIHMNLFFVVLGIVLLGGARLTRWRWIGAAAAGICSTYSFANGVLFWPLGLLLIVLRQEQTHRQRWSRAAVWSLITALVLSSFFYDYGTNMLEGHGVGKAVRNPMKVVEYAVFFIGGNVAHDQNLLKTWAPWAGAGGMLLFVVLLAGLAGSRWTQLGTLLPYIGLGLYAIGTATMTGYGRAFMFSKYHGGGAGRYVTLSNPLWIALVILLLLFIEKGIRASRRHLLTAAPAAGVAILLLVAVLGGTLASSRYGRLTMRGFYYDKLLVGRAEMLAIVRPANRSDLVIEAIANRPGIEPNEQAVWENPRLTRTIYKYQDERKKIETSEKIFFMSIGMLKKHRLSLYRGYEPVEAETPAVEQGD